MVWNERLVFDICVCCGILGTFGIFGKPTGMELVVPCREV